MNFHKQKTACGATKRSVEKVQQLLKVLKPVVIDVPLEASTCEQAVVALPLPCDETPEIVELVVFDVSPEPNDCEQVVETQTLPCDETADIQPIAEFVVCDACQKLFVSDQALEAHWEKEHEETHGMAELIKSKFQISFC